MESSSSPEQLKAQLKELIKQCKLKEATQIADKSIDSSQNLQLQQQVLVLHWCTKAYNRIQDVKKLTVTCLSKVKDLIKQIQTNPCETFKGTDGKTPLT